jgi:hypothetical protein
VQTTIFGGVVSPRSDEAVQRDVMAAVNDGNSERLPTEITQRFSVGEVSLSDIDIWGTASFCTHAAPPCRLTAACSMDEGTFNEVVRRAMSAGFVAALVKYREQLAGVPALSRFYDRQSKSQRRGRESQSNRKQTRAAKAVALAKSGKSIADIVTYFRTNGMPKCQRSTVYRWLKIKPPRSR